MLPTEESPKIPEGPLSAAAPVRRTLPPPEWMGLEGPRSAASVALERYTLGEPVARRTGARAELESLTARMAIASRAGDEAQERALAATLARALAAMGVELDQSTKLARRSLLLGDDPVLREELATWFAMLGEPALAAATLRALLAHVSGAEAGQVRLRIGTLLARAGEARAARDALEQALAESPTDPLPAELLASLGAWATDTVSSEEAARFYLEAAERRARAGERAAAFENTLRAFEVAPEFAPAAERLAQTLSERTRVGAADEVRREHARHAGPQARAVHLRRKHDALRAGDLPRALGAALDARLDAELEPKGVLIALAPREEQAQLDLGFDELLERLGLLELLAARLELACDLLSGRERARARVALARLYAGALARPERAVEAFIDALVADPGSEEARLALLRHAATSRDHSPLVEALVRVAEGGGPVAERVACLREVYQLADERLQDGSLMAWAVRRLMQLDREDATLGETLDTLAPRVRLSDEALAQLRAESDRAEGPDRIEPLSRIASLLLSRPDNADQLLPVLLELVELAPEERSFQGAVERVLGRQGRFEELEAFYERLSTRAASASERARLALLLSNARRRRGDLDSALSVLAPVVEDAGSYPAALSMAVLLAAQKGDEAFRARALLRLATVLAAPLRAVLCAFAGEALLRAGDVEAARRAVDQAAAADPAAARPAAARAAVAMATRDRWGAQAMERAIGVIVPRAALCAALAESYDKLEEPALAFAFCLRQIALRPGDLGAARDRLGRALRARDGARLADTLSWLLSQPQPLAELSEDIASALRTLAPLEPTRGAALARRALDVMGPRSTELRLATLAVADVVGERGLAIATIERWLASGAPSGDRAELILDLARRRRAAGDADGSARALMRAIRDGAWATSVLAELDVALPARTSDGEIALLFARAEALSALSEADQRGTARAWRELGAAYWDLAGDEHSALRTWEHAAALDVDHGVENLGSDLVAFGGPEFALTRLSELAARRSDPSAAARVLGLAATIALETGRRTRALDFAVRALDQDPRRTDILAVLERAVDDQELEVLERLYVRIGQAALGRYGERAVHYRAARQLEKRRAPDRAFQQALRAFEAVPSEGVVFVTMVRLAERTGQTAEVVRAIERVAAASRRPEQSSAWLRRAAMLAGPSEEGLRQRVEVLLRALLVRPDADVLSGLGQAVSQLCAQVPDERPILELRMRRAVERLLPQFDGPEGARVAIAAARFMLGTFRSEEAGLAALERAIGCDSDLAQYAELLPFVDLLAPHAGELLAHVLDLAGGSRPVGAELLDLCARLAEARGDSLGAARLYVEAAQRDPENAELAATAERAARSAGDARLLRRALDGIALRDRKGTLIDMARAAAREGDRERAMELYEQARSMSGPSEQARALFDELLSLYRETEQSERVEILIEEELQSEAEDGERRTLLARKLAAAFAEHGDPLRALAVLDLAQRDAPRDRDLLAEMVALARTAGDYDRLLNGLLALLDQLSDPEQRRPLLREVAELHERVSNYPAASRAWAELSELDPHDADALAALEREAERGSDYDALIKLLSRRASLAGSVDEVRRIRLRRATVLEQRLGRADEARAELEALTVSTGDHLSVLRVLADLNERLGTPLRAAPLWLRASAVTPDRDEAADLSCRACDAYLLGGDVESARRILDGIQVWSPNERVLTLIAEVERRRQDPLALADALDDLSGITTAEPARRAELLVEAAEASLAGNANELGLARAVRAARLSSSSLSAQLLARSLEYRLRGAGSSDDAETTLNELSEPSFAPNPEQAELLAFLRAEALEAQGAAEKALAELDRAEAELGLRPLIALGLGERLGRIGQLERALGYFDAALGGDLRGLRGRGKVAWHAAEVARALGDLDRTASYLETAVEDPETKKEAQARIRELFKERVSSPPLAGDQPPGEPSRPRVPSQRPGSRAPGALVQSVSSERALASLGLYSQRPSPEVAEEHISFPVRPSLTLSAVDSRASLERAPAEPAPAEPAPEDRRSEPPPSSEKSAPKTPGRYSLRPEGSPEHTEETRADSSTKLSRLDADEASLYSALAAGSREAGLELIEKLEHRSDRTHDLVAVCRRLVATQPADSWALGRLHRAALGDKNFAYARAIEHVIGVLDPGAPYVEPPPLADQTEQPDAVRTLLMRDHAAVAFEAMSLVWEGAEHVFRRDPSTYGVTGLERVPLGAPTPLARAYSSVAGALGMLRTPLFQRRSAGAITVSLALLSPPAVVLSGDVRQETPELRFHLGAMLLAATPPFVLLLGSPESQARAILKALGFAFGAPNAGAAPPRAVPSLAEVLWESIPARQQRRLRELCDASADLEYDSAIRTARSAVRRAGLFTCGDLGVALSEICREESIPEGKLKSYRGVAELAQEHRSIRSLLLLATSPEYAQIRWWLGRAAR
ncbi:MAG TPA: hypothetical protein VG937_36310 [Polyangiaceae bacterium]|nr:hypothetical protein [Polyangiaceae bacterium]